MGNVSVFISIQLSHEQLTFISLRFKLPIVYFFVMFDAVCFV